MKVLFYSTKKFERTYLESANKAGFEVEFITEPLSVNSFAIAKGYDAVSIFTGDDASESVIKQLKKIGIKFIALRAAGYDNTDLDAANENQISVANVPEYSPYAIAEHAVSMMLALSRKTVLAASQVKMYNFSLDNLVGFDLKGKTIGIIGTGKIGSVLAKILYGFGCTILAYDVVKDQRLVSNYDVHYVELHTLCSQSDIISIHTPLNKLTKHLINETQIKRMKKGVMLINTARGGVVKTEDIIASLENGEIGYYGMDVYEKEKGIFFFDHSSQELKDPVLKKLLSMPNVMVTPHQAFATKEALTNIAETTFHNLEMWSKNSKSNNELTHNYWIRTMPVAEKV